LITSRGVAPWVFADDAWFVTDPNGPHVAHEQMTVSFAPTLVADFEAIIERIDKIVAPTDDTPRLDGVEGELRDKLGAEANIERSQAYYVDVTHPLANKGEAVRALAVYADTDVARTVVIGDMANDVAMFRVAGFSIAMGQAPVAVKSAASVETGSNTEDGFAQAVRAFVLPRLAPAKAEQRG
jgi:hydroxymethylpyrimidine pyrophosphatase-like HAD family hydrolase